MHVLCRDFPESTTTQYHLKFGRLCRSFDNGQDWILFLDANARVGEIVSEAVGPWQGDAQDTRPALAPSFHL